MSSGRQPRQEDEDTKTRTRTTNAPHSIIKTKERVRGTLIKSNKIMGYIDTGQIIARG